MALTSFLTLNVDCCFPLHMPCIAAINLLTDPWRISKDIVIVAQENSIYQANGRYFGRGSDQLYPHLDKNSTKQTVELSADNSFCL